MQLIFWIPILLFTLIMTYVGAVGQEHRKAWYRKLIAMDKPAIQGDNRLIASMGMAMMIVLGGAFMLSVVQRIFLPQQQVQPEQYGMLWLTPAGHIMNVSYSADGEPEYFGEAQPGTSSSTAGWRIYRYEYEMVDGYPEIVAIRFASGNTNFDKVWDDRAEYEYS